MSVPMYWIWSNEHGAWWAADRRGFVRDLEQAGRYTADEAAKIVTNANIAQMDRPGLRRSEIAIPVEGARSLDLGELD